MVSDGIAFRTVHELIADLAEGNISAAELTEIYLARIERLDEKLHAFVSVYRDDALDAASAADQARRSGHAVGPLHGIPVAVKDIVDIQGRITTGGSKVWQNRVSSVTATLVSNLLRAGMVVLGKTHTVEFAMGSFGTNQHMGAPWNPWDPTAHRAPGGSSAGSGVSVAAGLSPWAIGTDTGGSVRIPAAWCGLTGLKTTIGRVSCAGVLPLSTTLDTPGPMCHSVEDAALLFRVLEGSRELSIGDSLERGVRGLRFARAPESELVGVDDDVGAAYDTSLSLLESLGASVESVALPRSFAEIGGLVGRIIGAEGYSFVGELVDDPAQPVDDHVRPRIQLGRNRSARDYLRDLREKEVVKAEYKDALAGFDALLTPAVAAPAPRIDDIDQSGTAAGFTRPANLLDYCALALPNGMSRQGLPTALQIVCREDAEITALTIGRALQRETDWHRRVPDGLHE